MSDTTMYTQGNWKVARQTSDTSVTGKNVHKLEVPVLQFGTDYVLRQDEPNELILNNKTATGIDAKESIRYGYVDVDDVFKRIKGLKVPTAERPAVKTGVQTLVEVQHLYHAVNTVSGEEITLPALARLTVVVPSHCAANNDMLNDIVKRTIAGLFSTDQASDTALTSFARVEECAKGSLKPSNV